MPVPTSTRGAITLRSNRQRSWFIAVQCSFVRGAEFPKDFNSLSFGIKLFLYMTKLTGLIKGNTQGAIPIRWLRKRVLKGGCCLSVILQCTLKKYGRNRIKTSKILQIFITTRCRPGRRSCLLLRDGSPRTDDFGFFFLSSGYVSTHDS